MSPALVLMPEEKDFKFAKTFCCSIWIFH